MKGYIYIAGAFCTVKGSNCGQGGDWIDNDPHFWCAPPTWGICRSDLRRRAQIEDVIFFVLPRKARHPQTIFAYLTICAKITHSEAFHRQDLISKRTGSKNPNGNIIVDANGDYTLFDCNVHKARFQAIKDHYVVGDPARSKMLEESCLRRLAPSFVPKLQQILQIGCSRPIDLITRAGRELTQTQTVELLNWLGAVQPLKPNATER